MIYTIIMDDHAYIDVDSEFYSAPLDVIINDRFQKGLFMLSVKDDLGRNGLININRIIRVIEKKVAK